MAPMPRSTFPLRFRKDRVRELVRVVAEREGISQNELLEQAAEHEVLARGALLADELEASAARLRAVTATAHDELVERSISEFVVAEGLPEPLRARQISRRPQGMVTSTIGAVAAFRRD